MTLCGPVRAAPRHAPPTTLPLARTATSTGITVYGCDQDEADLVRQVAARLGVRTTIAAAPASEANADLALGHRCVSVSHRTRVTGSTLLALRRAGVEYISTRSIGLDHIDLDRAQSLGLTVGNVEYSPGSVADYTLMLMLMLVRDAGAIIRRADAGDLRPAATPGRELRDLTVGVVGTGRIGSAVLHRLRGFDCPVLTHDRSAATTTEPVTLDELLARSDVVTLHTPLNTGTHHLLDRRRIGLMKRGAYLVNTGRGPLVDTEALISALERGHLGGVALDVLEGEEEIFSTDRRALVEHDTLSRLQSLPNVIVSPHTAYCTDRARREIVENSLIGCLRFEAESQHG